MLSKSEAGKLGYAKNAERSDLMRERQHAEAVAKYEAEAKCCRQCATRISFEGRRHDFCSRSCSATYNNLRKSNKPPVLCKMCGKYTNGRLYCKACRADGVLLTFEESQTDGYKKKILLKERGHRCESCGLSEWLGKPIPLEMDHTDGNSDNSTRGNLKLLCPNCHAQTPTYRSKNIGKAGSRAAKRSRALKDTARELAKALYNWPSTGELKVMLMTLPMTRVAKKLGIPYKVFQKHCAEQGIASRGPGGWGFVVRDKTYNTDP